MAIPWQKYLKNRFLVSAYLIYAFSSLPPSILNTCMKLLSDLLPEIGGI
jgi:hypothetical protein